VEELVGDPVPVASATPLEIRALTSLAFDAAAALILLAWLTRLLFTAPVAVEATDSMLDTWTEASDAMELNAEFKALDAVERAPPAALVADENAPPAMLVPLEKAPPPKLAAVDRAPPTALVAVESPPPITLVAVSNPPPTTLVAVSRAPPTSDVTLLIVSPIFEVRASRLCACAETARTARTDTEEKRILKWSCLFRLSE